MLKFLLFAFLIACLISGFSRVASGGQKEKRVQVGSVFQAILAFSFLACALYFGLKIALFTMSY